MSALQHILDTGEVDEATPTETLEAAVGLIEFQIEGLRAAQQWGPMAQAQIQAHQELLERIQDLLNGRRGLDGMTPLTK